MLVITKTWRSGVILSKLLSEDSIEGFFSACSVADAGSSIPETQRKGEGRHNENKEPLGSTSAKETGSQPITVKTTRTIKGRKVVIFNCTIHRLQRSREISRSPPAFALYGLQNTSQKPEVWL